MKGFDLLRIYDDWEGARQTVLRRRHMTALDEVPEPVQAAIERVFGEVLTPEAAVARILADVRQRGDEALHEWTARIDGRTLDKAEADNRHPCDNKRPCANPIEVPNAAMAAAYDALPPDLSRALDLAAERIRAFHTRQPIPSWTTTEMGGVLGQRVVPLRRVGVYVPGGTAPLPSSLLMAVIPARVAGVDEIFVCTPPAPTAQPPIPPPTQAPHAVGGPMTANPGPETANPDPATARPPDITLAAAHIAGVDRLFMLGGAQAIAAMAYGTATVPQVDKIVGAGGLFTTLAKRQVYGQVGLDGLYGPTETVVVADDSANPAWVASDLLAQAEHDVLATAILLTPSRQLAEAVQAEVARQLLPPSLEAEGELRSPSLPQGGARGGLRSPSLPQKEAGGGLCPPSLPHEGTGAGLCPPSLPQGGVGGGLPLTRTDIITTSLSGQGGIVLTPDLETAVRLADEFAPEHLCLSVREPEMWAQRIRNAGGLFLGEHSFEVLGDYVAGPSHIMPTGGTAKWASPVNVLDFVKIVNVIGLDADTAARISPLAARIADAESLTAHAAAARSRGCRNRPTGRITCHRRKKVAYDQH